LSFAPSPPYPYSPPPIRARGPLRQAPEWQRNFVIILTILYAAISLAYSLHSYDLSRLFTRIDSGMLASDAELSALDNRGQFIGVAMIVLSLLLAAFTITWLYAARRNAAAYDGGGFRRSRGWTIGGWFCPIVNLWFPYQCMADAWTASTPHRPSAATYKLVRPSGVILLWWLTLVGSTIASRASSAIFANAETTGAAQMSFWFDYTATALDLAAAASLVYIVITVTSFQRYRFVQARISHPYAWSQQGHPY
jgi:hypothetical protein